MFCIISLFHPFHTSNLAALKSIGRSDIYLKLDIIKKLLGVIILVVTYRYGPLWIARGILVDAMISVVINTIPTGRLIGYGLGAQLKDLLSNIASTIIMAIAVLMIGLIPFSPFISLLIKILVGIIIYTLICIITQNETWVYCLRVIKSYWRKNEN